MNTIEVNIPNLIATLASARVRNEGADALRSALNATSQLQYEASIRAATKAITGFTGIEVQQFDGNVYLQDSFFDGLPVWMPIQLKKVGEIEEDLVLESSIVTVSRPRNIVFTEVQGRDGEVIEFISNKNWQVSITGIMAKRASVGYPKEQITLLKDYCESRTSVPVISELLNMLNIYEVVITGLDLPPTPFLNCAQYRITAVSSEPIELTINT